MVSRRIQGKPVEGVGVVVGVWKEHGRYLMLNDHFQSFTFEQSTVLECGLTVLQT